MRVILKNVKSTDGKRTFYDVQIYPNSGTLMSRKAIISCPTEHDRERFMEGLRELIDKHTYEYLED